MLRIIKGGIAIFNPIRTMLAVKGVDVAITMAVSAAIVIG